MFDLIWAMVTNVVGGAAFIFRDLHKAIGTFSLVLSLPILFAVYRLFLAPILGESVGSSDGSLKPGSIVAGRIRQQKKARVKSGKKNTGSAGNSK